MKKLIEYKDWILAIFVLSIFFFYLDKKTVLILKEAIFYYKEIEVFKEIFSKIIETFHKIFLFLLIMFSLYLYLFKNKKLGKGLILSMIIAGIFSQIKFLIGRARPKITYDTLLFVGPNLTYNYASFPSGHVFFLFVMSKILSSEYPKGKGFFYGLAILVALQRILVFAHFPSDVIGGAFLGYKLGKSLHKRLFKA
uniref:Phosphatase PAP2 family protein n=1 Tax=Thermodesulfobacterium geofontis TaxID=1295609 RepID=A0A7C4JRH9_9BACT